VAFQERLLPAGREHLVHRLAGIRQAQHEQEALGHHPGQPHPQLAEVHLGVLPGRVMLGHEHPGRTAALLDADLRAAPRHVIAHRRVRHPRRAVLLDQPGTDPLGGVPLLARRVQVRAQPPVDDLLERLQLRRAAHRGLPRRRLGAGQRLPDQPPVHPVLPGQRTYRQPLTPRIMPDPLEQLDLRGRHGILLDAA